MNKRTFSVEAKIMFILQMHKTSTASIVYYVYCANDDLVNFNFNPLGGYSPRRHLCGIVALCSECRECLIRKTDGYTCTCTCTIETALALHYMDTHMYMVA